VAVPALGGRLIGGAIVVLVTAFALAPVLLSRDIYSYVDYARLGALHGLDPYQHTPAAAPADPAFARVAWKNATTVYGPLFTLMTYPLAWLPVAAAVAILKALAGASVLGVAVLVARLSATRGVDPVRAAAFVALNPLVLVHVAGGGHNDGLAMLAGTGAIAAVLSAREAVGGATFVAAFAIKAPAALAAPFAFVDAVRSKRTMSPNLGSISGNRPVGWMLLGIAVALVAVGIAGYAAFGWHWLDALGLAGKNQSWTSHMSVPITAARLTGLSSEAIRIAALGLYALLFAHLLAWTWRGGDWVRAAAWASLGLLLATSWLLPWYLIWALPLAAISRDRPLQLLVLALTAFQLTTRIPI
jgi:alpha-1,6-mannosyltransferase